ncbi:SH3 domain-containing protein [Ruminococcaceae bacterium OttesenSCG-928-D13]|nr:SH3 domain-containing protein [Ruminococcaceae bacterium OttesenSCG-928-D13]
MDYAVVKASLAPLRFEPSENAKIEDEVLFGMAAEVLEQKDGWLKVRTHYEYEGWLQADTLETDPAKTKPWATGGKMTARAPWVDVMAAPDAESARVAELPRGGLLHPVGEADAGGWLPVELPGGGRGYAKSGNLMPRLTDWKVAEDKGKLREAIANTALSYLGTQYRSGGKTPLGIDCSGLASMAYLLNGAVIWRDAEFKAGFGLKEIGRETLGMGDLIYFKGHMAVYLADGMYVHSTGRDGSDGVVLNSLREDSTVYRKDLAENVLCCASLFE